MAQTPRIVSGLRDRTLLLLGFAGAFRQSELVAYDVCQPRGNRGQAVPPLDEVPRHLPFVRFIRHLNPYCRKNVIVRRSKVRVPVAYHYLVIASVRKQRCRRRGRNPACRGTSCKKTLGSGRKPSLLFDFLDFRILYSDAHDAIHIISY
jgi:hypothetical protein